jgi:hypothetical protein
MMFFFEYKRNVLKMNFISNLVCIRIFTDLLTKKKSKLGCVSSFQNRAKLSISLKNRKLSGIHKESIKFSRRKKKKRSMSMLTRQKISLAHKGKKTKESTKKRISDSLKKRFLSKKYKRSLNIKLSGKKNPMFGKKHSIFTKRKISRTMRKKNKKKDVAGRLLILKPL